MTLLDDFRLILVALWLGAAAFFSFVVAPGVFSVLRAFQLENANEIAGTIVTRTLAVVNISGFAISLVLLVIMLSRSPGTGRMSRTVEIGFLALLAFTTGIGHWVIGAKMRALRAALLLPIDQVDPQDPRRLAFDNWHRYSVFSLSVAMLAAIVLLMISRHRGGG